MSNRTVEMKYFFSSFMMTQEENTLTILRDTKLNKYFFLRMLSGSLLVVLYATILLSFYAWLFSLDPKPGVPQWDTFLHQAIASICVPLVVSCFFGWFAWILFNRHELVIESNRLVYTKSVIIKVSEHFMFKEDISSISITENEAGFGILFDTVNSKIYTFHFPRYKRSGFMAIDRLMYYRKEFADLEFLVETIRKFLKLSNSQSCN